MAVTQNNISNKESTACPSFILDELHEEIPVQQEKLLGNNRRVQILNTTIDVLDYQETIDLVEKYVKQNETLHLMGVNADKINALNKNELLKQIVNRCGVINADGASVISASRFLGKPLPERIAGVDLMLKLLSLCEKKEYSVYLLGAKQKVVEQTAEAILRDHPTIKISGIHNGYFKEKEWPLILEDLQNKSPDFVFVGITSPLKEYLIEYLQYHGVNSVFMGVGGTFDVISGNIKRAPLWMQKSGLEWFYRVLQEPRRLFKRYFVGNIEFIFSVLREKLRNKNIIK